MRRSLLGGWFALVLLLPSGAVAASGSRTFVERVRPEDFYAAETLFGERYSAGQTLVVLRTTAATPSSVLAIAPAATGDGFTLTLNFASAEATGGWLKISEDLESVVGQQVLRAVELTLHHQVTLSKFKRLVSKTDRDVWVYQRLSDGRVAAAAIDTDSTLDNPAAVVFLDDLLGGLQQLVGKEGSERAALLQQLDRTATDLILTGSR